MNNPIINNRLINDHTFARRLQSFLSDIEISDIMSLEELEYFQRVADNLLYYQIQTCANPSDEYEYLRMLKLV